MATRLTSLVVKHGFRARVLEGRPDTAAQKGRLYGPSDAGELMRLFTTTKDPNMNMVYQRDFWFCQPEYC